MVSRLALAFAVVVVARSGGARGDGRRLQSACEHDAELLKAPFLWDAPYGAPVFAGPQSGARFRFSAQHVAEFLRPTHPKLFTDRLRWRELGAALAAGDERTARSVLLRDSDANWTATGEGAGGWAGDGLRVIEDGWAGGKYVASKRGCAAWKNGGCFPVWPQERLCGAIAACRAGRWDTLTCGRCRRTCGRAPCEKRARAIAIGGSDGYFHVPLEAVVALRTVPEAVLRDPSVPVLVEKRNRHTLAWLELVDVAPDRVVDFAVAADELYAPEMGRCGRPSLDQIAWLRGRADAKLAPEGGRPALVFVERTDTRTLTPQSQRDVARVAEARAAALGLDFSRHDPSQTLVAQLEAFRRAKVVVATHGAALVHLVAARTGTCVVELMGTNDPWFNLCYTRIAIASNLNYEALSMNRTWPLRDGGRQARALRAIRRPPGGSSPRVGVRDARRPPKGRAAPWHYVADADGLDAALRRCEAAWRDFPWEGAAPDADDDDSGDDSGDDPPPRTSLSSRRSRAAH